MCATSLLWALAWTPIGIVSAVDEWGQLGAHLSLEWSWPPLRFLALRVGGWTIWGAITGAVFAIALIMRARSHDLERLSIGRVALYGALAGLALPSAILLWTALEGDFSADSLWYGGPLLGFVAAFGAGLAAGTLALARRKQSAP